MFNVNLNHYVLFQALIWFHLHEYAKSFSILDALYQNIEPIDVVTDCGMDVF